ncbi:MAG: hypothetical protein QOE93_1665, partial [Actinomycetota bacterium]|nr:hypothetical protein [Actinomycetota bacterium]
MFGPTIEALRALGGSGAIQEINEKVIELEGYTDEQLAVMHGHGEKSEIEYRLAWARTNLKNLGAVTNRSRSVWALTEYGRTATESELVERDKAWRKELAVKRAERLIGQAAIEPEGDEEVGVDASVDADEDWKMESPAPAMPHGDAARRSSASGDRLHALWVLLATTGMRRGEALGLRWSDVDLDTGRLRVVQTIIQVRSKVTTGEPKTARGRRPIALDSGTIAVLREHRRRSREERLVVGGAFEDRGLVFHRPDGSCLKPDAVSATFVRRVRAAGLRRLTLKGLRHTWATLALERGIHPRVVQERLGHSTIAITLGIYSHVAPT